MREARRADVRTLAGLMRDFYAESGYELDDARAGAAFAALLDEPRLGRVWLVERDPAGDVVGYVVVTFVFAMEFGGRMAVVDDFYVRPDMRGDGLGKAAIAAARRAREELGARAMRVEVGVENAVARAVYRSAGFTELKDHQLMTLPLAKVRDLLE